MADRVLIVDDDEAVCTMLYKVIRSNGIEADTAASGQQALRMVEQKRYDLMLLDVNMPGMDGFYDLIWGGAIIDENAIMVYVNRLRQKIEDEPSKPRYIQTVRGLGYRFVV